MTLCYFTRTYANHRNVALPVALKTRDIPNLITVLRMLLVAPIIWLLLQRRYTEALLLILVAGASDGVDGLLAKHFGWTTRLGGILDPLADKLLLMGTFLALAWIGDLPVWLAVLVILRDVIIVSGAVSYHYLIESVEAKPLLISKINTLLQILLVFSVVFSRGVIPLPQGLLTLLIYLTALTTLWSGIVYMGKWGRQALQRGRHTDA